MGELDGRVAIVTGASRGIGRAVALELANRGARVVAAARGDHADVVASAIREAGGEAESMALDVTDRSSIETAFGGAIEQLGRIDILVNNAGIARDQLLLRMKQDEWDDVLTTNLTGAFACCQAVLRPMVRQRSGRIVNISSVVGQTGNAGQVNYAASKAGLIGFSKSLAQEVASRGITVNVVAPGLIETDMTRRIADDAQQGWRARIPVGRLGAPEDVARAVGFLVSDDASYITGHVLAVNGGMYM